MLTRNEKKLRQLGAFYRHQADAAERRAKRALNRANMQSFKRNAEDAKRFRTKSLRTEMGQMP